MFCPTCGYENPNDAAYCQHCGSYMNSSAPYNAKSPLENEQASFQQPHPASAPMYDLTPTPSRGVAIASMVLGIASVTLLFFTLIAPVLIVIDLVPFVLSIVGLILAVRARRNTPIGAPGRGFSSAGLALSIAGLVLSSIFLMACIIGIGALGSMNDSFYDFYNYYW